MNKILLYVLYYMYFFKTVKTKAVKYDLIK